MKTYPKYKDSGVEWLGEIPAGWEVSAIKNVADLIMGQSPNSSECSNDAIGLPFLQGCSDFGPISPKATTYCETPRKTAHENDFLLSVRAPVGALNIANQVYGIGRGLCAIRVVHLHRDFAYHLLMLASSPLNAVATGSTYAAITVTQLANLQIPLPPLPEQRAIAAFLDHEVAKIDELIAEQERLIELLAEKRQATISHAVTKGLDPNAKLKPSGVEWLGDVPEDWEVVPLKYLVRFDSGSTPSKERLDYWDGAIPWASAKDLKSEYLSDTGLHISNNAVQDGVVKIYPAGVVIVLVRGMTLAKTFPVCLTRIPIAINQDLKVLTPIAKISGEYLALALRGLSKESLSRVEEAGHGTKALRMSEWTSMHVPVPPEREQPKLVSQIELFLSRVDSLTTAAREAIALLQERRSSLISAAVTGKIDVRDFVAAEEESA